MNKFIEFIVEIIFVILIFLLFAETIALFVSALGLPGIVGIFLLATCWIDHKRKK